MKRTCHKSIKLSRLCRALRMPRYQVVGILECLWNLAAMETPQGNIGRLTDEEIAAELDFRKNPAELIEVLVEQRWLDRDDTYRLIVHDWHEHADDATKKALTRKGLDFVRTVSGQCRDSVETTADKICLPSLALPSPAQPRQATPSDFDFEGGFETLSKAYPAKGRIKLVDAQRWYVEHMMSVTDPAAEQERILASLANRWSESKTWAAGYIPALGEWIRNKRWLETPEPAEAQPVDVIEIAKRRFAALHGGAA